MPGGMDETEYLLLSLFRYQMRSLGDLNTREVTKLGSSLEHGSSSTKIGVFT